MTKPRLELDELAVRPVAECTAREVAGALSRCFEGYLVPVAVTPQGYERRFRGEDLDPFASRLYLEGDSPAAVLLLTRRGWTSRVAAMAVAAEWRGRGLGRRVMREAVGEATARGDRALLLEVFEPNTPAVSLYTDLGFRPLRRLVGYRWEPAESRSPASHALAEIDPLEFARLAAREGEPGLPWMLASESFSAASAPARAYQLEGRACALIADPDAESLVLRGMVVPRALRRQGWGSRLLRALAARFPGRSWTIPAIVPEDLAPAFLAHLGWERQALTQLEMRLELHSGGRDGRGSTASGAGPHYAPGRPSGS